MALGVIPGSATFLAILERMTAEPQGALHLTAPEEPSAGNDDRRPCRRTRLRGLKDHLAQRRDMDATLGRLFGEQWVSGADLGVEAFSPGSSCARTSSKCHECRERRGSRRILT